MAEELSEELAEIEGDAAIANELAKRLQERLLMRVAVRTVPTGSLPRFEGKAKRWVDQRQQSGSGTQDERK